MLELCDKNRNFACTPKKKIPTTEDRNNVKACDNYMGLRMGFPLFSQYIFVLQYKIHLTK